MTTLAQHRAAVEAATATLNAGRRALLDGDGRRLYADHEHERREQELRAAFRATITEATDAATAVVSEVDAALARTDADPAHRLMAAELERAVALKALVGDRLMTAPLREVDDEVQALLREGDRAARYVAWRAVTDRRRAGIGAGIDAAPDLTGRLRAENSREAVALGSMAERLLATLADVAARDAAREREAGRRSEAQSVLGAAGVARYFDDTYGPRPTPYVSAGAA